MSSLRQCQLSSLPFVQLPSKKPADRKHQDHMRTQRMRQHHIQLEVRHFISSSSPRSSRLALYLELRLDASIFFLITARLFCVDITIQHVDLLVLVPCCLFMFHHTQDHQSEIFGQLCCRTCCRCCRCTLAACTVCRHGYGCRLAQPARCR